MCYTICVHVCRFASLNGWQMCRINYFHLFRDTTVASDVRTTVFICIDQWKDRRRWMASSRSTSNCGTLSRCRWLTVGYVVFVFVRSCVSQLIASSRLKIVKRITAHASGLWSRNIPTKTYRTSTSHSAHIFGFYDRTGNLLPYNQHTHTHTTMSAAPEPAAVSHPQRMLFSVPSRMTDVNEFKAHARSQLLGFLFMLQWNVRALTARQF